MKNKQVVICPSCGGSGLQGRKGVIHKGFTLIELLVVVLIIGILAAVALPQYQRTVIKTRISTLLPLVKSIIKAQEVYFLENGTYIGNPLVLDFQIPAACQELQETGFAHQFWACAPSTLLYISPWAVSIYYCPNKNQSWPECNGAKDMQYTSYYAHSTVLPGKITCYYYNASSIGKYMCENLPK